MKKILSFIMIIMMVAAAGCGQKTNTGGESTVKAEQTQAATTNKLEQIKAAGKLVVGTSADFPPYEYHVMVDGKDEIVGFDVEIMKELAKGLGVELEIQDMGFDAVLAGVGTGIIDIGVAGVNKTPEREAAMDFSEPYFKGNNKILVLADGADQYKTLEDLDGKTIGVQIASIQEKLVTETMPKAKAKSLGKLTDLVLELKTGMIDAILLSSAVADSYEKQNPELKVVPNLEIKDNGSGASVITAKGETELMAEINKIVIGLKESGKVDQYFAEAVEQADSANE